MWVLTFKIRKSIIDDYGLMLIKRKVNLKNIIGINSKINTKIYNGSSINRATSTVVCIYICITRE